ncbi:hypothetical protein Tco_1553856 [Tanacetum coccineum]
MRERKGMGEREGWRGREREREGEREEGRERERERRREREKEREREREKTARALVDVHKEELTLRVGDEKLIFNSASSTPSSDLVVTSLSPSLTPFGDSDFLLEETDAFLALDDSIPPKINNGIYDSEGDILFIEKLLNDDPTKDLSPKELKMMKPKRLNLQLKNLLN